MRYFLCFFFIIIFYNISYSSKITGQVIYHGVRASGMSGAFTAVNRDVTGVSYNPASISDIDRNYISAMYIRDLYSLNIVDNNFISYAAPIGNFYHSVGISNINVNYDYSGNFFLFDNLNWRESNYNYTFALDILKDHFLGITAGYTSISNNLTNSQATGYNINAGYIGKYNDAYTFGFSIRNLISTKKWDTGRRESDVFAFRTGLKYNYNDRSIILADIDGTKDVLFKTLHLGAEYLLWHSDFSSGSYTTRNEYLRVHNQRNQIYDFNVFVRAGLRHDFNNNDGLGYSVGLSAHTGSIEIDYSFGKINNNMDATHSVALKVAFGGVIYFDDDVEDLDYGFDGAVFNRTMNKANRIAVLDFSSQLSSDFAEIDYTQVLPEIIKSEIITRFPHIQFASNDDINRFDIPEILNNDEVRKYGLLLDIDYLIMGNWHIIDNNIRVNLKLYSADNGQLIINNDYLFSKNRIDEAAKRININK